MSCTRLRTYIGQDPVAEGLWGSVVQCVLDGIHDNVESVSSVQAIRGERKRAARIELEFSARSSFHDNLIV